MKAIKSPPSRRWPLLAPYNYVYIVYLASRVLGSAVEVNNGTSWLAALHDDDVDFIVLTGALVAFTAVMSSSRTQCTCIPVI